MEDDEEYSYKGYSERTRGELNSASFKDNEEVYSYAAYSDEAAATAAETDAEEKPHSYGDFIVEEFSAETNVPRVAKLTKIPERVVIYVFAAAYLIVGILCVAITDKVTEVLPYIVGSMMAVIGTVSFILAVIHKEYRHLRTNKTAGSLIIAALGAMIIFQQFDVNNDSALMLISVVWGILGLFEGARAFNHAFKRIANSERCIYYLIRGIIECAVAFMLLYRPDNEAAHHFHILVFGINLILDSVTMIPQVKAFLAMK